MQRRGGGVVADRLRRLELDVPAIELDAGLLGDGGKAAGALRAAVRRLVDRLRPDLLASATAELELSPSDEVLYARVPAGATAWQPELADGLSPGGSYLWFVRAVLREENGEVVEAGDWSSPRFFEVAAAPSAGELELAIEVIRRWEAANGDGVIHRDLRPANIKITPESKVKVLDFGLAKLTEMELIAVPGATGYLDTNYVGKGAAAALALPPKRRWVYSQSVSMATWATRHGPPRVIVAASGPEVGWATAGSGASWPIRSFPQVNSFQSIVPGGSVVRLYATVATLAPSGPLEITCVSWLLSTRPYTP